MAPDDDDANERGFEPPLPPEDRLWRHPSEMADGEKVEERIVLIGRPAGGRVVAAGLLGLLVGAALSIGALAAIGAFDEPVATTAVERLTMPPDRDDAENELAIADKALPAIARIDAEGPNGQRSATAVAVRDDGYLLTTSDAVDSAETITVTLEDGTAHTATLVGRDRRSDVAVLDIDASELAVAAVPDGRLDELLQFGDRVIVIDAAPPSGPAPALVRGYVAHLSRSVESDSTYPMFGMIHVDVEPNGTAGSHGAVLIDSSGALVGIVTARASGAETEAQPAGADAPTALATHFATPFDHAKRVFDDVMADGSYQYPRLGVTGHDLDETEADQLGVRSGAGLLIDDPESNSPAQHAGLRRGDVITEIDRTPVASMNDVRIELRRHRPGDAVDITVVRHGRTAVLSAVLETDSNVP